MSRVVAGAVVGVLAFGCGGSDTAQQTTAQDGVTASETPASVGCATESNYRAGTGGSYPFFASVEELVLAADLVVVGTVSGVTCEDAGGAMMVRRATIAVGDTLHGDERQQVEIVSSGDEQGGPIPVDGVPPPVPGETAIWFLQQSQARPGTFEPVGPQGRYRVEGPKLTSVTQDTDARVHEVAQQIAAMGRSALAQAVTAASQAIATGQLTDEWSNPSETGVVASVRLERGPVHCGWQDMRFLYLEMTALPPDDPQHQRTYVANPALGYDVDGWDPDTDLPDSAVDTGWRRGTTQLWLTDSEGSEAAYLVDGPTVERLPLDDTGHGCA